MKDKGADVRLASHEHILVMNDLASRVVASTGIPSDRSHLGKLILQRLKETPEFVSQIDGSRDESETNASILQRSIRCATEFRNIGMKLGDVMALIGYNILDLCIPYYAAFYLGITVAPVYTELNVEELVTTLKLLKPKLIVCQARLKYKLDKALLGLEDNIKIIILEDGNFLKNTANVPSVEDFRAEDYDTETTLAILASTSGTTGLPKYAKLSHRSMALNLPYLFANFRDFNTKKRIIMTVSPLIWVSGIAQFIISPILNFTRVQMSAPQTPSHMLDVINKYRPTTAIFIPTYLSSLLAAEGSEHCDFTCFEEVILGGGFVYSACIEKFKRVAPKVKLDIVYGLSENSGAVMQCDETAPLLSIGKPVGFSKVKIVDENTLEDICKPFETGELWIKGPALFKGYYNKPQATKEQMTEDGWLRTGDLVYRDENHYYFYVDRASTLLNYKSHRVSPLEIESVIRGHPGVSNVCVTSIDDKEDGDLAVACVVRHLKSNVTAQDIEDIVKDNLPEYKHLKGGVIFQDALPLGPTTKCDRRMVKNIVLEIKQIK